MRLLLRGSQLKKGLILLSISFHESPPGTFEWLTECGHLVRSDKFRQLDCYYLKFGMKCLILI